MKVKINIIDPDTIDSDELIRRAQRLNEISIEGGINNIFQPGLVKEIIIAKILGHNVVTNKRMPDACNKQDQNIFYEYLTCYEGGLGQLDRMFKYPPQKKAESLRRITRNSMIYFAIFYRHTLKEKIIFEIDVPVLLAETEEQLNKSKNDISHVGFYEIWATENGRVVYRDEQ